jgi:uroporphyrinogen decarboxylase|tara:strand:- start:2408 stop:3595 length:1188 start_codon:yes stop_codon:yes gene_type:complete
MSAVTHTASLGALAKPLSSRRAIGSRVNLGAVAPTNAKRNVSFTVNAMADEAKEPLLVRAAKGLPVERPPAWMMRQAGRYMQEYRDLAVKYPSFRERSETTDLITEITLQPWRAFQPDGVILFSDILTPLPAIGIPFEIDDYKGPILDQPIRDKEGLKMMHALDLDMLPFVGEALGILRKEVGDTAAVLGFVGAPWTLATYIVEGGSSSTYKTIKSMAMQDPETLKSILSAVADAVGDYVGYQIDAGAQCVQIFDSWGGQLPPHMWEVWSKPYIQQVVDKVRATHPGVPLTLYANGSGGLLERMATTGVDCIGLDWTIDMEDGRRRVGNKSVQGNVDPAVLFAAPEAVEQAVKDVCDKAGPTGHILNLGHGVLVGTPEENVKVFFDAAKKIKYDV